MLVLVTGAAGFIGAQVVDGMLAAGHQVRALDRRKDVLDLLRLDGTQALVGDVRDPVACERALTGVDAVCHQAAMVGLGVDLQDLPRYASDNDLGTATLLAAMDRVDVGRLVLASSMVVYGEGAYRCAQHGAVTPRQRRRVDLDAGRFEPPCPVCGRPLEPGVVTEDAPFDPRNVYAATKVAQEHLAGAWARQRGGSVVALRYHNVYGPGMPRDTPYAGVASLFRSAIARGEAPRVFEDGGQRRDFVHVRDVARANVTALDVTTEGALAAYNVASGQPRTVLDLATALSRALDGPTPVVTGEYRLGDIRHVTASAARMADDLGWSATVEFGDGITELATA